MVLGRREVEELLKQVLSLSSAGETEAVLLGLDEGLTRFANNGIHQHAAETNRYVVVRVIRERHDLLLIGATGEGLFEQRLLGSIPERVAREAATTVTMTKRYWRLKSLIGRMGGRA